MTQQQITAIEALVNQADTTDGHPGYHIRAAFPDGSVIDAPILSHGPNYAVFDEIVEDGLYVDFSGAGASLQIDWLPGPAFAEGPRFDKLDRIDSTPGM